MSEYDIQTNSQPYHEDLEPRQRCRDWTDDDWLLIVRMARDLVVSPADKAKVFALVREHRGRLIWATDDWLAGYCSALWDARARHERPVDAAKL